MVTRHNMLLATSNSRSNKTRPILQVGAIIRCLLTMLLLKIAIFSFLRSWQLASRVGPRKLLRGAGRSIPLQGRRWRRCETSQHHASRFLHETISSLLGSTRRAGTRFETYVLVTFKALVVKGINRHCWKCGASLRMGGKGEFSNEC
jgi:hypothetical protein